MKKIVFHVSSLAKGGSERVLVNLASYFASLDEYEVIMATHREDKVEYPLPQGVRRINVDLEGNEISKSRVVNFFRRNMKMRNAWKAEKADLVLSVFTKTNFRTIITTMGLPTKAVVAVVSIPAAEYPTFLLRMCAQVLFALGDGVVLKTNEQGLFFRKAVRKKAVVLPNSVNPDFLRDRYNGERKKEIVLVGRLVDDKNPQLLINAFSKIADEFPDWFVSIYGEGEIRGKLENMVNELNMESKVYFRGVQNNIADKIESASIFVLASNVEGMPNVLLEAMSLGMAAISTNVTGGGPAQLIQNGKNGLLIPMNDEKALIDALRKLMSDEILREKLGMEAHKIQEYTNPQHVNKMWQNYFESILEK